MEIKVLVMPLFAAYYKRSNLVKIIEIGQAVVAHKLFISVSNKQLSRFQMLFHQNTACIMDSH